ncbi:hypothetical protein PHYBOEH_005092 [Phytophthora boehmeriae]|uniref:Uncharacterized protein n=1 Tax=Phytophthora boehmeriae TaxID=109152 RepID=A0A8T1X9Y8_9STRA|nr:hypothetical protein PHYBOEH_005092 [Phytophthora boehmeriae]
MVAMEEETIERHRESVRAPATAIPKARDRQVGTGTVGGMTMAQIDAERIRTDVAHRVDDPAPAPVNVGTTGTTLDAMTTEGMDATRPERMITVVPCAERTKRWNADTDALRPMAMTTECRVVPYLLGGSGSSMASDESTVATLPGLEPSMMSPTGTVTDEEANSTAKKTSANSDKNKHPAREPNLLFAVAKNVVRATTMKKPAAGTITSPNATGEGNGSVRMMFGKFRRSEASKLDVQASDQGFQPVEQQPQAPEDQSSNQQPANKATKEFQPDPAPSTASADTDDRVHSDSQATAGPGLVDNVRDTLERLVVQLDSVDPRKLLAVRLGGELRGLLGKAQDEFAAYEAEFVEHVSNEGVSVSLRNFSASLMQVPAIAERLRTAKFMLNRTFKREVLFAFQEINSYYTSLFMELSMAVARRSGIELPLPAPVAPPPEPEHPAPSGDEICLDAHQHFFGHGVTKNLRKALELYENDPSAQTRLGVLYTTGNGVKQDMERGVAFLEKVILSSAGE